jgi:hypothetical protein
VAKSSGYTIQIQVNAIMPSDRDKVHKPSLELSPARWLWWFLKNHDNAPLISAGLWKRSGLVVESVGDRADAVQAAYSVAGADGAWLVVLDVLRGIDVAVPPIDDHAVDDRRVALNTPRTGSLIGKRRRDSW